MTDQPDSGGYSSPACLLGELDDFTAGYWNRAQRAAFYGKVWRAARGLNCAALQRQAQEALQELGEAAAAGAAETACWQGLDALLADATLRIRQDEEVARLEAMRRHIARHHAGD